MSGLEDISRQSSIPIVKLNQLERVFNTGERDNKLSIDLDTAIKNLPSTIIDKQTLLLIQLKDLHNAVDHSITRTGSMSLFKSLVQPPTSLELILAKQESVRELEADDKLRNALANYLGEYREGEAALFKFLNGFYVIGNNTILVTHDHDLVASFKDDWRGQYLQAEFNGSDPTYRLIEGISRESHAERVAENIGFSERDIQRHLTQRGYLKS